MTQIQAYVQGIRARIREAPLGRKIIAVEAGLADQALRDFDREAWNPTTETLSKVEAVLDRIDAEGEAFTRAARRRWNERMGARGRAAPARTGGGEVADRAAA